MKVLHVFKTYFPDTFGGIEQCIYQLCKGGEAYGINSKVLCISTQREGIQDYEGHSVYYVKPNFSMLSTPFSFSAIQRLRELAEEVDLVHYHFPWPFMDLAHFLVRHNKPYVISYHSDIVKQRFALHLYKPLMNKFLSAAAAIVASSPNYLKSSSVLQGHREKVSIIPIGLDKHGYPSPAADTIDIWRQRLPARFFLFVGVLRYYKGLHTLLEAARISGCSIVIAGSGPEEKNLKDSAVEQGLNNVVFLGKVSDEDKVVLLSLCTATVFPSHLRSEAFGISLVESSMYSKPMICCEIGTGTTYINIDNLTGLVVPPENSGALAEAMLKILSDPSSSEQMGHAAFNRYLALFTSRSMAQRYAALYERVLL